MNKDFMKMFLLLTVLQITFCVQASAGKKQSSKKTLSKKELKAQAAFADAEFEALIIQEKINNDKEYEKIIKANKQIAMADSSEDMRHVITNLTRKLQENYVSESDILLLENAVRAIVNIENELMSRSIKEGIILTDQVFIDFFNVCESAFLGTMIEVPVFKKKTQMQVCVDRLLEQMQGVFYGFKSNFHQEALDIIHDQLVGIISKEDEVVAVYDENGVDDTLVQSNLATFRIFLSCIESK